MKAITAAQMRAIESASVAAGVSLDRLMENAGLAVADAVTRHIDPIYGRRVVVLIGPGNNGSDGFVAARHLARRGATVRCFLLARRPDADPKRELAERAGSITIDALVGGGPEELRRALGVADVVLDAVLGTGRARPITSELGDLLGQAAASDVPVHAIDLPTGLDADTGRFDPLGLPAAVTYMLGFPKIGALERAGEGRLGQIELLDIGIPAGLVDDVNTELLDADLITALLPGRPLDANKGTFGRALVVAGSPNYVGAAALATLSAARSGAGLVELAARRSVYELIAGRVSDAIYCVLPETDDGQVDAVTSARELVSAAQGASVVLVGPGLGREPATESLVRTFTAAERGGQPIVLDADCLNILAGSANWWDRVVGPCVLTPHPGEMGRLLGISAREVQDDRVAVAREAAKRFGAIVVLKGAATVIASPDGCMRMSPWVNPGLAKGGTGDVLAGLLVGLLAQIPDRPADAAAAAVYIHGLAGEIARRRQGETAMTASDVVDSLPAAFQQVGAK
jgi:NAD(P)H-hydrate epimerase